MDPNTLQSNNQPEDMPPPPQPPMPEYQPAPVTSSTPPPPAPITETPANPPSGGLAPQPVVQVLSPRGVEYVFLTVALLTGAVGLVAALISLVNGETSFSVLAFPVSVLLVAVPVFAWLFLRLKKAELADPSLRLDASKRRSTQLIQVLSFLTVFFTLIGLIATVLSKLSGDYDGSLVKVCLNVLVLLVVAGGILFYYWQDEHKS